MIDQINIQPNKLMKLDDIMLIMEYIIQKH